VTDVTRSTVSLIWSAPVYDGGSKVVGYIIERKPVSEVGDGRWLKCNYTIVSDNFFTVTALSEGDTYEFRVLAKNAAGVISKGSESTGPHAECVFIVLDESGNHVGCGQAFPFHDHPIEPASLPSLYNIVSYLCSSIFLWKAPG
jgi:hypothetical protein